MHLHLPGAHQTGQQDSEHTCMHAKISMRIRIFGVHQMVCSLQGSRSVAPIMLLLL